MTKIHPTLVPFLLPVWHMTITGSDYLNLAAVVERLLVRIIYIKSLKKSQIVRRPCTTNSVIFFSLIQHKSIKEVNKKVAHGKINSQKLITNLVKLYYSAHNCECEPICFCYKLCFTEKRTYLNRLKFPIL